MKQTSRRTACLRYAAVTILILAAVSIGYHRSTRSSQSLSVPEQTSSRTIAEGASSAPKEKLSVSEAEPAAETVPDTVSVTTDMAPAPVHQIELIASAWGKDADAKVSAFTKWTEEYTAAPTAEKEQLLEQGVSLAKGRLERMSELIEQDPERALANAVPMAVRNLLPPEIQSELESRLSGYGSITRINPVRDDSDLAGMPFNYAEIDGVHYIAYTYGRRAPLASLPGASLHAIGLPNEAKIAVLDSGVRRLEQGEDVSGKVINESCPVSGKENTTIGTGAVTDAESAPFQVGNQLFGTCSPEHAYDIDDGIRRNELIGNELLAKNQDGLTFKDLQALNELHIMAYGGASGTAWPAMPGTSITTGTKRVLVMLVRPAGWAAPPWSQSYARDVMFGNNCPECWGQPTRSVANQLSDFSYGKLTVTGDATPVLNLPKTRDQYIQDYWGPILADSKAAAQAAGYNISSYNWFVVAHAGLDWGGACGWGGDGNVWCNGCYGAGLLEHELGHGMRLPHANGWYITDGNPWGSRTHWEYYDCTDPMGNGNRHPNNHFNSFFKYWLGWYPQSSVLNVTASGTYRIYQFDQRAANLNNPMALLFRRGSSASSYWVSFRGSDALGNFANAAQIHEVVDNKTDTHLLDFNNPNPDTDSQDNCNGGLTVNQSYTDSVGNLTIRTVGTGGTVPNRWLDFQVTFGGGGGTTRRYESYNFATYFMRHSNFRGRIDPNVNPIQDSQFVERAGLNGVSGTVSLESVNRPGYFLRHRSNGEVWLDQNDNTTAFRNSATWFKRAGLANSGASSFEAQSNPGTYLRHRNFLLYREAVSGSGGNADATFWIR
jgi:hypothetical protein